MEKLLEMAKKVCDQAEVYSLEYTSNPVSFENAKLKDIESSFQSGYSLRIIKDGKLGFAYTRNLIDQEEFLQNALESLKGGVEAKYDLPKTTKLAQFDTYDLSVESLSATDLVSECERVSGLIKSKTDSEISLSAFKHIHKLRLINTKGTDVSSKGTYYGIYALAIYPGTGSGIYRYYQNKKFVKMPDGQINEIIDLYNLSSKTVEPPGGRMKVLFMPNSQIALTWRIARGLNSRSVYEKISPMKDKIGEKIFDEKLTIYDDPLEPDSPDARVFDDEGIPCKRLNLIENGALKSFYYDLNYAGKLKSEPTGHGYKTSQWGGDAISLKPIPALTHYRIKPGEKSFMELVKSMDRGVIIEDALGPHSGNIPNGDFSIGVCPGLYVEKGEIVGQIKDAMIAGNIYDVLKNVVDIGDTQFPVFGGACVPPILLDDVNVSTK